MEGLWVPGPDHRGAWEGPVPHTPPSLVKDFLLKGPRKCSWVDPRGHSSCPGSLEVTCV